MLELEVSYDLWHPPIAQVPLQAHYAAAIEQCEYVDRHGFDVVHFNEHHGTAENYVPSPLVVAAAVAARTRTVRTRMMVLAPFYHPVKLAEDIAVLDLISGGRAVPLLGAGYRAQEFEMFGKDLADRRRTVDSTAQFLRRAWTGEAVEFEGRTVRVTPTPVQKPCPPILIGGTTAGAARAAARYADGFHAAAQFWGTYREERIKLGKSDPGPPPARSPFIHVAEDPERDWPLIAPYLLAAIGAYHVWTRGRQTAAQRARFNVTPDQLRTNPQYRVVTPDDCVELIDGLGDNAIVNLRPGWGGYDPDLAWSSLELFVERVMPRLRSRLSGSA